MDTNRSPFRVYADTSVFGGVFDEEYAEASNMFFDQVESGGFSLITSAVVQAELEAAPSEVQQFFERLLAFCEITEVSSGAIDLQKAYIQAGIITPKWETDALHVALATVSECSLIVSWNFKHIVHFRKIPLYNAVNVLNGYPQIAIYSPLEVIEDEDKEF
jgi:predicted nucleic acid-binding protein